MGLRRRALENEKWSGEFDVHLCELDSLVNMDDGSLGSGERLQPSRSVPGQYPECLTGNGISLGSESLSVSVPIKREY